jgi:hypothetical protein|tara:strand:- start:9 stop:227 length:219 start_codon:yes stop_codon:yes gene_type:complete
MKTTKFNLTKPQIKKLEKKGYEPRPNGFSLRIYRDDPDADIMFQHAGLYIEKDTESMELFIVGVCEAKYRED